MAYFDLIDWSVAKDFAATLQSFGILIGLFWGGIWTYRLFIQNRQKYPRANLSHKINQTRIDDDKIILQVKVIITNIGNVLICLRSGFTRISQVRPSCEEVVDSIKKIEEKSCHEIPWPMIDKKEISAKKDDCEIEPGESEEICFDFVIDGDVETVYVYSYFANVKKKSLFRKIIKKSRDIGWKLTSIYNLKEV